MNPINRYKLTVMTANQPGRGYKTVYTVTAASEREAIKHVAKQENCGYYGVNSCVKLES